MRSAEGQQALHGLSEAAERNWKQLVSLEESIRESGVVEKHFTAFKNRMDQLQARGGIHNRSEFAAEQEYFRNLQREVTSEKSKVRDPQAKQALSQLLTVLHNVLQQFK